MSIMRKPSQRIAHRYTASWIKPALFCLISARCGALGVRLLSGRYGRDELKRSGALRVYEDPADLHSHIDAVASRIRQVFIRQLGSGRPLPAVLDHGSNTGPWQVVPPAANARNGTVNFGLGWPYIGPRIHAHAKLRRIKQRV